MTKKTPKTPVLLLIVALMAAAPSLGAFCAEPGAPTKASVIYICDDPAPYGGPGQNPIPPGAIPGVQFGGHFSLIELEDAWLVPETGAEIPFTAFDTLQVANDWLVGTDELGVSILDLNGALVERFDGATSVTFGQAGSGRLVVYDDRVEVVLDEVLVAVVYEAVAAARITSDLFGAVIWIALLEDQTAFAFFRNAEELLRRDLEDPKPAGSFGAGATR